MVVWLVVVVVLLLLNPKEWVVAGPGGLVPM